MYSHEGTRLKLNDLMYSIQENIHKGREEKKEGEKTGQKTKNKNPFWEG